MSLNTIILQGDLKYRGEARAASALKPGHLIEFTSSGTVQSHSTAGGKAQRFFAVEDSYRGGTIDGNLPLGNVNTTYYQTGELVFFYRARPGDVVQVLLAVGQVAAPGAFAVSNGDGTFKVWSNQTADGDIVGTFEEALDLSAAGSAQFTKLRVGP